MLVRGDHRVNEIKLAQRARRAVPAGAARTSSPSGSGPPGYIGPVGIDVPILLDDAVAPAARYVTGANRADAHLRGVEPGRDFPFKRGRRAHASRRATRSTGTPIRIEPAIEIGNIFKLGTRYSEPLGATYLDESGKAQPIWMGSYGIGPARIAAAAVEQFADEQGISWPRSLAPFDVHLVGLGKPGTEERELAERALRGAAREPAWTSSTTTATRGPGEKFADAELLGVPLRLTVGPAHARGRRGRGAGPARARDRARPARGRRRRRPRTCGATLP